MTEDFDQIHNDAIEKKGDTILKELHSEMRALRDTEFKNAALFYQVCAFLVAGGIYLFSQKDLKYDYILEIAMSIFLMLFWISIHIRISIDHANYAQLGARISHIRKLWGLHSFLGFGKKPLGQGNGHRATQATMAVTAIFVLILLTGGALLKINS